MIQFYVSYERKEKIKRDSIEVYEENHKEKAMFQDLADADWSNAVAKAIESTPDGFKLTRVFIGDTELIQ